MFIYNLLKQFFALFGFDEWRKEEFKPFKKSTIERLVIIEKQVDRFSESRKENDRALLDNGISVHKELITQVFQRLIEDFEKFHHNERNFSNFLLIQNRSVQIYTEDREKYQLKRNVSRSLIKLFDDINGDAILYIKKYHTPEIMHVFTTYDKEDRKEVIINLILKFDVILQEKFEELVIGHFRRENIYS